MSTLGWVLLIVILFLVFGSAPRWNHSRSWGYGPSSALGIVFVIVLVLVVLGRL